MSKERAWQLIAKKLAGEASVSDLAELEELLRNDPDLHYALENVSDIWKLSPKISKEAEQAFSRHVDRLKENGMQWSDGEMYEEELTPVPSRKKWYIISLILLLFLTAFCYFYFNSSIKNTKEQDLAVQSAQPEIKTLNGSRTKIVLPDGSLVSLNSGSTLSYDKNFGNGTREVSLKGEAFFDVKHDANRPFIIHTNEVDVKVLGTAFNVKSYPAERITETSLIRGSLLVIPKQRPDDKVFLKPDQKVLVKWETDKQLAQNLKLKAPKEEVILMDSVKHYERNDDIIVETAWADGKLVFSNDPFKDMVVRMQRWFNVEITCLDPIVEKERFTANFDKESIQQVLDALSINGEFTYRIEGNKVTLKKGTKILIKK